MKCSNMYINSNNYIHINAKKFRKQYRLYLLHNVRK